MCVWGGGAEGGRVRLRDELSSVHSIELQLIQRKVSQSVQFLLTRTEWSTHEGDRVVIPGHHVLPAVHGDEILRKELVLLSLVSRHMMARRHKSAMT